MLNSALKEQLKGIFAPLEANYTLEVESNPSHPKYSELVELSSQMAECSDKITHKVTEGKNLRLNILKNDEPTGVSFRAVPTGHEFSSLILSVMNADGKGKNIPDEYTIERIKALKAPIKLTTYMSLTCTNCPDVIQTLNLFTLLGSGIEHEAVDGAINAEEVDSLGIQAVPTVYADGEQLHVGRGSLSDLLDKLEAKYGSETTALEAGESIYDVIVAGGGPAGITSAIYLARKGQNVAVIAERIGGQVNETVAIENIPSVKYTTGAELASDLKAQAAEYGVALLENRVMESFSVEEGKKIITVKSGHTYSAPQLIIATGAKWRRLGIEGEAEYIGRGVAFCPHCDGPLFKDKVVAVIGGGNSGIEAAIDLAGICQKVVVLEFMETLKADSVLQSKLRSLGNVEIYTNTQTTRILGDDKKVTAIEIKNRESETLSEISLDGVFIQIGLSANSELFKDAVETNRIGEILTDKSCRTAVPGIYAAGDVSDVAYKQIVISMGEGAKAALSAFDDKMRGEIA
ncbi:MAG: alkyl hydroperoxide reductase subunit F [Rikenellaceae bacterium]